mgnify:CR=1 FL=1
MMRLYGISIGIVSLWNPKAKLWIKGRKKWEDKLKSALNGKENVHWFHCASLGEFEQARPLIEKIKANYPEFPILVSFFSPSGYEIRKNYELADYVCYLPLDTPGNAAKFISSCSISKAFFVKYEVWPNFFKEMESKEVPVYIISATFRKNQIYFKSTGAWFLKLLQIPKDIFVQDLDSNILLNNNHITSKISGDTRYDKVKENKKKATEIELAKQFTDGKFTLLAGSSWDEEERMVGELIRRHKSKMKLIIAPHDISDAHVKGTVEKLGDTVKFIRYSNIDSSTEIQNYDCIIIDNIGMLSNLYQYASIAFIGGGFTNALHNILEPAAFGIPVMFGNYHSKFPEAREMMEKGGGIEVKMYEELEEKTLALIANDEDYKTKCNLNSQFIEDRTGAADFIFKEVFDT